ncbi:alpha/beta-hydrolase family protein [Streptomyces sp. NPDC002790]|uniref:alpha/beta hydrolase n=1 Tax=Streptomyces sp. NPDC002790 TaxID=3154431 RepID=UPI00331D5AC4
MEHSSYQVYGRPRSWFRRHAGSERVVFRGFSWGGCVLAAVFYCLSLTPSLLPRAWWLQGLAAGVTAVVGYAVGAILDAVTRRIAGRAGLYPPRTRHGWVKWAVAAVAVAAVVVLTARSVRWQGDVRRAVSMPPQVVWWQWALVPLVSAVLALLVLGVARVLRLATRVVTNLAGGHVPRPVAYAVGVVLVALIAIGFAQGVLVGRALRVIESAASLTDQGTTEGIVRPELATLSGSPPSQAPWDSLGAKGRDFVGEATRREDIASFTHAPAKDPVRVYVGLRSADTLQKRADLAVRELERTGGFSRKVLAVMGTTGTGWINEQGSKPLEYMWGGDSALVAMQYSYLPSGVSVLTEDEAADAGSALFDAVRRKWLTLPKGDRPQLLVYGESLGSYAMEHALGGSPDALTSKVDGALFVGPTYSNPLWNRVTDGRRTGSPQWRPVYDNGANVRFAQVPRDYTIPDAPWRQPRSVYLQNGSDPVVWWSPGLAVNKPDWMLTPRAGDVSPAMRWYPLLTFWQVACDMAGAADVPDGYGHRYGAMPTSAWAEITRPPGWTEADSERLARRLTS